MTTEEYSLNPIIHCSYCKSDCRLPHTKTQYGLYLLTKKFTKNKTKECLVYSIFCTKCLGSRFCRIIHKPDVTLHWFHDVLNRKQQKDAERNKS